MKYKELDAFESVKQFKLDDYVRVYCSHGSEFSARVKCIDGNKLIFMSHVPFHFKSCRKLEEIPKPEPRTTTVCITCFDKAMSQNWVGGYCGQHGHNRATFIEVVEEEKPDPRAQCQTCIDGVEVTTYWDQVYCSQNKHVKVSE